MTFKRILGRTLGFVLMSQVLVLILPFGVNVASPRSLRMLKKMIRVSQVYVKSSHSRVGKSACGGSWPGPPWKIPKRMQMENGGVCDNVSADEGKLLSK